jgi:biopolymer transport protein TolQ
MATRPDAGGAAGEDDVNVHSDLSFLSLILQASVVVQAVLVLLAGFSLWSWWRIFLKLFQLRRASRDVESFEDAFWKGGDLNELYQRASQSRTGTGLEHIFVAGFREFSKHRKQGSASVVTLDSARRAMRAAYQREVDSLDAHLNGLATVGSVSPYIGLFGTVWGIMNAFRGLANVSQATLAQVAPGIAEALIATAIGLFAAIPAVVAYNRYTHDVDRLATRYETFIEEFSNILQRQG